MLNTRALFYAILCFKLAYGHGDHGKPAETEGEEVDYAMRHVCLVASYFCHHL